MDNFISRPGVAVGFCFEEEVMPPGKEDDVFWMSVQRPQIIDKSSIDRVSISSCLISMARLSHAGGKGPQKLMILHLHLTHQHQGFHLDRSFETYHTFH
ncbi:hypothetical protein Tco_0444924 [Tanacetum coccineum]